MMKENDKASLWPATMVAAQVSTMRRSINFLIGNGIRDSDRDLFFGPILETDEWFVCGDGAGWPEALVAARLFPSRSQARKNGWDKEVPNGFTCFPFGRLRHEVAVLKIGSTCRTRGWAQSPNTTADMRTPSYHEPENDYDPSKPRPI
jgi:hypothetical protein